MNRLALVASCLAVLAACDKKNDAKPAGAPGDKPAAPAKPAVGLNAPGNDPKIVELAKKALACKWQDKIFDPFDGACPEYKAWVDEKEAFANKKGEPTLVAFIEDPDDKVRYLGEKRLSDDLGELTDKALVARVLTVAEKAKVPRDMDPLGVIIGNSKISDPELFPRVKALVTAPDTHENLRVAMIRSLVSVNPDSDEVFNLTRETAKNTSVSKNVQRTALEAFTKLKTDKPARCDVFADNLDNPPGADVDHAGDALQWMAQARMHCDSHYDAMLKSLEARMKAKTANSSLFAVGLRLFCDPKGTAKPPQVKKALGLAHKLAEDKTLTGGTRASAIDASAVCDPKGTKAYLGKFKKETDPELKSTVERLLKKK